jgi:urease accessory protein
MRRAVPTMVLGALALAPAMALAHTGHAEPSGFMHGFAHPIAGIDHVLAMVAVGLLAAHIGGRALWLVPLSFVSVVAVAGALGMAGMEIPVAEGGIVLSVIVLGLAVALRPKLPVVAAMFLAAFFAVFHGYVHGAEMPAAASGFLYAGGFVVATVLLHTVGVGFGLLTMRDGATLGRRFVQSAGGAMALFGTAVLVGLL